jgi:hypothetical protein
MRESTVKAHVSRILTALDVTNRVQAALLRPRCRPCLTIARPRRTGHLTARRSTGPRAGAQRRGRGRLPSGAARSSKSRRPARGAATAWTPCPALNPAGTTVGLHDTAEGARLPRWSGPRKPAPRRGRGPPSHEPDPGLIRPGIPVSAASEPQPDILRTSGVQGAIPHAAGSAPAPPTPPTGSTLRPLQASRADGC